MSEVAMRIGTNVAAGGYLGTMRNAEIREQEPARRHVAAIVLIGGAIFALLGTVFFATHAGANDPDTAALLAD
jgi:hypothetical protein